ncbi:peptidoglycan DD-metalloendopeptidase family protein [Streptomyces sp. NPDC058045]|uniref:M23 family metallopeptidase n=1 Tax=Streptomyces sp. NPDC058045 TaxID=3346311 RepID=UPI0036F08F54
MSTRTRRPPPVPRRVPHRVLRCVLLRVALPLTLPCTLLLGTAVPATAASAAEPPAEGAGARVARLYDQAARAAVRYQEGRQAARSQLAAAQGLQERLAGRRQQAAELRGEVGRIARAQYRSGGAVPDTVKLLLADSPAQVLDGQRVARQAGHAVDRAVGASRAAQRRLAAQQRRADAAWRALDRRNASLARLKETIRGKLVAAREELQAEGAASVAAGSCRGAARLPQDEAAATAPWVAPVEDYRLSAGFESSGSHWAHRHTGQDFAVDIGTPVRAVGAGRVVSVRCGGPFGIHLVLRHDDGYYTQYAHLASAAVEQGERVRAGQWIGLTGTTGNSTGPHLHFEVRLTPATGSGVDPVPWLADHGVPVG